jgi:hypothetical protein
MGWLFTLGQTKKDLVASRTKAWDHNSPDGTVITNACLRHCYRGNAFSGVLWTVWERSFTKAGQPIQSPERWVACDLLKYQNDYGWGYKDMDESMHPYTYSCPLGYLELVPVACEEWREGVQSYHARLAERRKARRTA